jgi:predicted amidophosphoribosyltransferase
MDEIIKKIDEGIQTNSDEKSATIDHETGETLNTYVRMGLYIARKIILSEQPKEPCDYCQSGYPYYLQKGAKFCPMCGRPLNQPSTDTSPHQTPTAQP